jgi:hypothetical protein
MTETDDREKKNFLLWYEMATDEDKEKAKSTNCKKYEELLTKYKTEIAVIDVGASLCVCPHSELNK